MPRPFHALTMPFFSRPRHSTAVERRPVGYLPAFGFFQLPRGVPRRLLSEAYQSSSQRSIPGSSTLQKRRSVKLLDYVAVRIFPATTWTFTKDTALSEHGRGAAWRAWINGTAWQGNGMGATWARHAMYESAFSRTERSRAEPSQLVTIYVTSACHLHYRNDCILPTVCDFYFEYS